MTFSDWLQIALFVAAAFIGGVISWVFYREQQKMDFKHLSDVIQHLDSEITQLREKISLVSTVDQRIETINEKIDLQKDIREVVVQVKEQQTRPLEKLYEDVEDKTSELLSGLEKSIKDEIHRTLPDSKERDELIKQLVDKVDASAQKIDELQTNLLNEQGNLIISSSELIASKMLEIMRHEVEQSRLVYEPPRLNELDSAGDIIELGPPAAN